MSILGFLTPETQPLRLLPAVDRSTGMMVYIPEPSYRHALARGGPLVLSLDLEPVPVAPSAGGVGGASDPAGGGWSEPRTLIEWADAFGMSVRTMGTWFRSGQVQARKVGKLWQVALRDVPGKSR